MIEKDDIDFVVCEEILQDVSVKHFKDCKTLLFEQTQEVIERLIDSTESGEIEIPICCNYDMFKAIIFKIGGKEPHYGKRKSKRVKMEYKEIVNKIETLKKERYGLSVEIMMMNKKVQDLSNTFGKINNKKPKSKTKKKYQNLENQLMLTL